MSDEMKKVVADVVMVFGRKSAPVKPKPPGVDEILEDLSKAAPIDPLFSLVPNVAKDLVSNEEDSAEDKRYEQVAKYLSCEDALDQLQHKVTEVFGELVTSQKELAQVTSEVETQLESLRTARAQLGVPKEELVSKEPVQEDTEDLC